MLGDRKDHAVGQDVRIVDRVPLSIFVSMSQLHLLQPGQVAVVRTDTLYGLVASVNDQEAVEKVYRLKGRDFTKPCIVLVADKSQIGEYGDLVAEVIGRYEGAVTVVVPKTVEPIWITRGGETVAYRIPKDEGICELLKQTGPLIAPSANPQGLPPAKSIEEARQYFGNEIDVYLDGGILTKEMRPSKIIIIDEQGLERVIR